MQANRRQQSKSRQQGITPYRDIGSSMASCRGLVAVVNLYGCFPSSGAQKRD
jgi:hypothetical protein